MILFLHGHTYKYESEKVCRIFFPTEKIVFAEADEADLPADERRVFTEKRTVNGAAVYTCRAEIDGKTAEESVTETPAYAELIEENALAVAMVRALSQLTGITPPWGILTGVRPSKLMRKLIAEKGEAGAKAAFEKELMVRPDKTALCLTVAKAENEAVALSGERSFSLYISIPFCPTRCAYCSFVSHSIAQAKKLVPDYVRLLCEELAATAEIVQRLGLKPETVYFGGGTPTSLSAADLKTLLDAVNARFGAGAFREFTVEAGRPDTVDAEKLRALKAGGVERISINPQTFSDAVLQTVGRRHTVAQTEAAFALARSLGFNNINMDLIAGLPGDTPEGFAASVDRAVELGPENITVHTLALKRAANLANGSPGADQTPDMVEYAGKALSAAGYAPYYMYRQSKSLGNLENVGWAKPGTACLYNIYMMEETHSVLACGAGAVTKLRQPGGDKIERIYNFKYPYEYISRFPELMARKARITEFYTFH